MYPLGFQEMKLPNIIFIKTYTRIWFVRARNICIFLFTRRISIVRTSGNEKEEPCSVVKLIYRTLFTRMDNVCNQNEHENFSGHRWLFNRVKIIENLTRQTCVERSLQVVALFIDGWMILRYGKRLLTYLLTRAPDIHIHSYVCNVTKLIAEELWERNYSYREIVNFQVY